MNYFRNAILKLYDVVSAPEAFTSSVLAQQPQSDCDTVYFIHRKTNDKLGYGQTLKDSVENGGEKKKKQKSKSNTKVMMGNMIRFQR